MPIRCAWLCGLLVSCQLAQAQTRAVIDIGSRRELFVDRGLVETLTGRAELRLHAPTPRAVVLIHDLPWEGNSTTYHCLVQEPDRYRLYYRTDELHVRDGRLETGVESFCYAESDDGLQWRKPNLGLHEYAGSKENNLVLTRAQVEGWGARLGAPAVFRDTNPAAPPAARYKMFLTSQNPLGLLPMQSPDGIHWSPMSSAPVITDGAFDAMNLAYWDAERGEYRAYWRYFTEGVTTEKEWRPAGVRAIRTATSRDFLAWERQADLVYPGAPREELYENGIQPYPRAPHLAIGLPVRYVDRAGVNSTSPADGSDRASPERMKKWPASLRALPDLERRQGRAAAIERLGTALTEGLFMASRDRVTFERWDEAFLRPGVERPGTWYYGQQFVAWPLVETRSDLPGAPDELSLYASEGSADGRGTALRRYTLRQDGFVSVRAPGSGGELRTSPFRFKGHVLELNFATSAAGSIRVEVQDDTGAACTGFTLADCDEMFGDSLERVVTWRGGDLEALSGQVVRLRFELRDADLYSFRFQPHDD